MKITVETRVDADPQKVWDYYTGEEHIVNWNFAHPEWKCSSAKNDLRALGKFSYRMEAKDGSEGFDFSGMFQEISAPEKIIYQLDDGREVIIHFHAERGDILVQITFEPEETNSPEMQKQGWQAILDNFKSYVEGKAA